MAGFEGTKWVNKQLCYRLKSNKISIHDGDAQVYSVSRSIHYGLFLAFEGIRFFCKKDKTGKTYVNFCSLEKNLSRFQRAISYNLSYKQQELVPSLDRLKNIILSFFREKEVFAFLNEMAENNAQGYLRPFTYDEAKSIGVTFPEDPSIRIVACSYDKYLGEPFSGVAVPNLVRAIDCNGTGCLKLGVNYLMSVKAVDAAKCVVPDASAALFLDDHPELPIQERKVTEWDSSCCLFALRDGTVIKIPESNLILPSITIQGICALLKQKGITIVERDLTYGELITKSKSNEIIAVSSIGTAGILNRADQLYLVDKNNTIIGEQKADENHELYAALGQARNDYWKIYKEELEAPNGVQLDSLQI